MAQRLLILVLMLLGVGLEARAATPSPLFPHEGKPIIIVRVEGGDDQVEQAVRSLLEIEPGFLFSSADASRAIRRIYSLGRFKDLSMRVEPLGDALELIVSVTELERLGALVLEGDDNEEVRREVKSELFPGQKFEVSLLDDMESYCQKAWDQVGYFNAKCTATSSAGARRKRVDITIKSQKGEASRINAIVFTGDHRPPDWHLLKEVSLQVGDPLVDKQLKADERLLRMAYYKRGFLTAIVRAEAIRNGNLVTVSFAVTSGPRIALKVAGNVRFPDALLLDLLRRQPDEPLGRDVLDAWRRAVIAKFQSRGFAFADAKVRSFYESSRGIVHHVLEIQEGERASVQRLSFPGATQFGEERLRQETSAYVSEKMDASPISGEINRNAVKALEDSQVGIPQRARMIPPRFEHWLYREDPSKLLLPDAYRLGLEAIRKLYLEQGYAHVEVGPINVTKKALPAHTATPGMVSVPDRTDLEVSIPIKEGPRTMISVLSFGGTRALSSETLLELSKVGPGEPFSELLLEETRNAISRVLTQRGYLYSRIDSTVSVSPDMTKAEIRYNITDGPQVTVGRLLIQGNEETKDKVIGDRIALEPDQPYSPELAQSTKDELTKLETFSSVQVGVSDPEVPAEQKDVLVRLAERDTFRTLDGGLGFSTTQGVRGFVEVGHKNLFGLGQQVTARLQLNRQFAFAPIFYNQWADLMGARYAIFSSNPQDFLLQSIERLIRLSWRTPRSLKLPGRPQLYSDLTNERLNTIPFSLDSFTFLVGIDLMPVTHLGLVLETSLSYNALQCFPLQTASATATGTTSTSAVSNCDPQNLGRVTQVVEGAFLNWKSGPTVLVDFRDDKLNPRSGFLGVVKADFVLGEQVAVSFTEKQTGLAENPLYAFLKGEVSLTGYIPVGKHSSFVISSTAGNIFRIFGQETLLRAQLNERYYLGGRNTLRGYADRALLPQDACVVAPDAPSSACAKPANRVNYQPGTAPPFVPGAFKIVAKAEFRFPIFNDLMGGVFVDAGNLYFSAEDFQSLTLRYNFGAGIRYQTGVGAIALDIGLNPFFRPERGETVVAYPYIYFGLF